MSTVRWNLKGLRKKYRAGHCHINRSISQLGQLGARSGRDAGALPNLERCGSKFLQHGSFEEVTLVVESIVGCGMDGEEALRGAG